VPAGTAPLSGNRAQTRRESPDSQKEKGTAMSDVFEKVKSIVANRLEVDAEKITLNASFQDDLGADSLDLVELVMAFEEEFGIEIPEDAQEEIRTVGKAVDFIKAKV
jgi:acyl carrier protein